MATTVAGDRALSFDLTKIVQETFYWCGPATIQNLFSTRGKWISEVDAARRLGTTINGTDHIGLLTRELNKDFGGVYVTRTMQADPPTREQVELLWSDIQKSIDGGFGVAANIVVPVSNYPKATRGKSPSYSGGTVYHYISVVGYNARTREVLIADSGFSPYSYWMSVDQLASCIAGKGYSAAPVGAAFLAALSSAQQEQAWRGLAQWDGRA